MNTQVRNRAVLPVLLPLGVLLAVAALVGSLALILLYNTRVVSLIIALVVAAGVMVAMSLANSLDEEDMTVARKAVIGAVLVLPLLGGAGVSLWAANGGVDAALLNINREPHLLAPEGAVIGAQNASAFCQVEGESCTDATEFEIAAQEEGAPFIFEFDNLDTTAPHNVQIFSTPDSPDGELLFSGPTVQGESVIYTVEAGLPEGAYFFNCIVHPNMQATLTIVPAE